MVFWFQLRWQIIVTNKTFKDLGHRNLDKIPPQRWSTSGLLPKLYS